MDSSLDWVRDSTLEMRHDLRAPCLHGDTREEESKEEKGSDCFGGA